MLKYILHICLICQRKINCSHIANSTQITMLTKSKLQTHLCTPLRPRSARFSKHIVLVASAECPRQDNPWSRQTPGTSACSQFVWPSHSAIFAAVSHTAVHKQSFLAQRTLPPSGTTAGLSHHAIQPGIPSISQRTITNSKTRPKGLRIAWVLKQIRPEDPTNDLSKLAPVSWELYRVSTA